MTVVALAGVAVLDFVFSVEEMPTRAEKYRALDASVVGGGCAANSAVAIARLGGTARLASRVGDDGIASTIIAGLRADGVDTTLVRRLSGARSSFSSILVDRAGERQIVAFRDPALAADAGWLAEGLSDLTFDVALGDTRWPEGAAALLRVARERGVAGVMDAEPPGGVAEEALRLATHVAFSEQGLTEFVGAGPVAEALGRARARIGDWVCVTRGAAGVDILDDAGHRHVPAFPVTVVDTLGAGDVWHGAFALLLGEGADEIAAVRFANATAALKCSRFGGITGAPTRDEVAAFLKERP